MQADAAGAQRRVRGLLRKLQVVQHATAMLTASAILTPRHFAALCVHAWPYFPRAECLVHAFQRRASMGLHDPGQAARMQTTASGPPS